MNLAEVASAIDCAVSSAPVIESRLGGLTGASIDSAAKARCALKALAEVLLYWDAQASTAVVLAFRHREGALIDLVARATQLHVDEIRCARGLVALAEASKWARLGPWIERFCRECRPYATALAANAAVVSALGCLVAQYPSISEALAPLSSSSQEAWQALPTTSASSPACQATVGASEHDIVLCSDELINAFGVALAVGERQQTGSATVMTAVGTTQRNGRALAAAVAENRPVLVRGSRGSGKTAIIREVARRCCVRVVELILDDSADGRSLAGYYEMSEHGEFRWVRGAVANALQRGDWLVVEDVDHAPAEVLAMLLPVARDGRLGIPGRRAAAAASPYFRLLATTCVCDSPKFLGAEDWLVVDTEPLEASDLLHVARERAAGQVSEVLLCAALSVCDNSARHALKIVDRLARRRYQSDKYVTERIRFQAAVDCFEVLDVTRDATAEAELAHRVATAFELDPIALYKLVCAEGESPDETDAQTYEGVLDKAATATFVLTPRARSLLDRVARCVANAEPCLLVGQPGSGKTTCVQRLAAASGAKELKVLNLSHATDSEELLGGVRPISVAETARKLMQDINRIFSATFPVGANESYLKALASAFAQAKWAKLARGVRHAARAAAQQEAADRAPVSESESPRKRSRVSYANAYNEKRARGWQDSLPVAWATLLERASALEARSSSCGTKVAFAFIESTLAVAAREGAWVLLDEINLAPSDVLQRLAPLLDSEIIGDDDALTKTHPNFRVFAAMNPGGDVGKRELPFAIRGRFTEIYVREPTCETELLAVALARLERSSHSRSDARELASTVVQLHRRLIDHANGNSAPVVLVDGAGNAPRYSLRTFCRALDAADTLTPHLAKAKSLRRVALREGFELAYVTQLVGDGPAGSRRAVAALVADVLGVPRRHLGAVDEFSPNAPDAVSPARRPAGKSDDEYALLANLFWLPAGPRAQRQDWSLESEDSRRQSDYLPPKKKKKHNNTPLPSSNSVGEALQRRRYVLTPTSRRSLRHLARALAFGVAPILLQGPTCAGKTTLVEFAAAKLGKRCLRVNNHEHTDVSEYVGRYAPAADGTIEWRDGALSSALRRGDWLLLDELNLAPSEVLEALNRLLDDNRELRIAETGEIIKPANGFRLVATQNPAGSTYGGRKPLSRALRDRFVEIHVDELPSNELVDVVCRTTALPSSLASRIVDCHAALQRLRLGRGLDGGTMFQGRHSLSTSRDVLKWAKRCSALEKSPACTHTNIEARMQNAYRHGIALLAERLRSTEERTFVANEVAKALGVNVRGNDDSPPLADQNEIATAVDVSGVAPTFALRRVVALILAAVCAAEPVLLIGETGGGKTTACELVAAASGAMLHIINCHMHSEAADFLGSLRPTRRKRPSSQTNEDDGDQVAFEWQDGALVAAMRAGDWVLLDELNLADDAVLERLNSVLEPTRTISLAEKGGELEEVVAAPSFRLLATMNPGGDHGKRELSPALRSRFTEIWVPTVSDRRDREALLRAALLDGPGEGEIPGALEREANAMVAVALDFEEWCRGGSTGREPVAPTITTRDLRAWATVTRASMSRIHLAPWAAFGHGAALACLDGLSLVNAGADRLLCLDARRRAEAELVRLAQQRNGDAYELGTALRWDVDGPPPAWSFITKGTAKYGAAPFFLPSCHEAADESVSPFCSSAPTTAANFRRVLRACVLPRAVLLEGPPGVGAFPSRFLCALKCVIFLSPSCFCRVCSNHTTGKSALVAQLAQRCGVRQLARINLSEHADLADLIGADLPTASGEFCWHDGPLLDAVKAGGWVLLDELNLAPQQVLEGLNACLDHRAELFVPELGTAFKCNAGFRLFATQNPVADSAGRRLLPQSFLDRFTRVAVAELEQDDLTAIAASKSGVDTACAGGIASITVALRSRADYVPAGADVNARDVERLCAISTVEGAQRASVAVFAPRCRDAVQRAALDETLHAHGVSAPFYVELDYESEDYVRFGAASLPRSRCFYNSAIDGVLRHDDDDDETAPPPPIRQRCPASALALEACARALRCRWPLLLVGQAAGDVAAFLANATDATLWRLQLSPATDVADLLGGYEQVDVLRLENRALSRARSAVATARHLIADSGHPKSLMADLQTLAAALFTENDNERAVAIACAAFAASARSVGLDPSRLERAVELAMRASVAASSARACKAAPHFHFIDGPVVAAAERGAWLALDDANLCPPSVLDRLNALLEPGGELTLSECSGGTETQRIVKPHPSFRVILCINPSHGELSRALRNRCVEVALDYDLDDIATMATPKLRRNDLMATVARDATTLVDLVGEHACTKACQLVAAALRNRERFVYAAARKLALRAVFAAYAKRPMAPTPSVEREVFDAIVARSAKMAEGIAKNFEQVRLALILTSGNEIERRLANAEAMAALDTLSTSGVDEVPLGARRAVLASGATAEWTQAVCAIACCSAACGAVAVPKCEQIDATLIALDALLDQGAVAGLGGLSNVDPKRLAMLLDDLGATRDALAANFKTTDNVALVARRCRDVLDAAERLGQEAGLETLRLAVALESLAAKVALDGGAACPPSVWRSVGDDDALWRACARGKWPKSAADIECISSLMRHAEALAWPSMAVPQGERRCLPFVASLGALVAAHGRPGSRWQISEALATALAASCDAGQISATLRETMRASPVRFQADLETAVTEATNFWRGAVLDLSFDTFADDDEIDGWTFADTKGESAQSITVLAFDELQGRCRKGESLLDRWAMLQVAPLYELVLVRNELELLAQLHDTNGKDLAPRIGAFTRDLLETTARSPADAANFTLIQWRIEAKISLHDARCHSMSSLLRRWVNRLWLFGTCIKFVEDDDRDEYALTVPKQHDGSVPTTGLFRRREAGPAVLLPQSTSALCEAAKRLSRSPTPIVAAGARRQQIAASILCLRQDVPKAIEPLRRLLVAYIEMAVAAAKRCHTDQRVADLLAEVAAVAADAAHRPSMWELGWGWAMLGAASLSLAAPSSPDALDPALVVHAERQSLAEVADEIRARAGVTVVETRFAGVEGRLLLAAPEAQRLVRRLDGLALLDQQLEALDLERPTDSPPFCDFCADVLSFATTVGSLSRVQRMADTMRHQGDERMAAVNWCDAAAQFERRLDERHAKARPDVVEPVLAATAATRLGLGLLVATFDNRALPSHRPLDYPFVINEYDDSDDDGCRLDVVLRRELQFRITGSQEDFGRVRLGFRELARQWREAEDVARHNESLTLSGFTLRGATNHTTQDPTTDDAALSAMAGVLIRSTLVSPPEMNDAVRRAALLETADSATLVDEISAAGMCVALADCLASNSNHHNVTTVLEPSIAALAKLGLRRLSSLCANEQHVAFRLGVSALLAKLKSVLVRWPANATLERAARVADALLRTEMPNNYVAGLEILLRRAQDWQEHCAAEFSLEAQLAPLRALSISTRKSELETWSELLADREARAAASPAVLRAVPRLDAVVLNDEMDIQVVSIDIFSALNEFANQATMGDFSSRVALFRAFAVAATSRAYSRCLFGLADKYAQFEPEVRSSLSDATASVRKALADEHRLAKWDDRNFHALSECANKSRAKLTKLLREYDDALARPAVAVIAASTAPPEKGDGTTMVPDNNKLFPACSANEELSCGSLKQCPEQIEMSDELPVHKSLAGSRYVPRLGALSRRMVTVLNSRAGSGILPESPAEEILASIFGRIDSFRKIQKSTRSAKRRAVLDLIKGLMVNQGLQRVTVSARHEEPRTSTCAVDRPQQDDEAEFRDLVGARDFNRRGHVELERLQVEEPQRPRDVTAGEAGALRDLCRRLGVMTLDQCSHLAATLLARRHCAIAIKRFSAKRPNAPRLRRMATEAVAQLRTIAAAVSEAEILYGGDASRKAAQCLAKIESTLSSSSDDDPRQLLKEAASELQATWAGVGGATVALEKTIGFLDRLDEGEHEGTEPVTAEAVDDAVEAVLLAAQCMVAGVSSKEDYCRSTTLYAVHAEWTRRLTSLVDSLQRASQKIGCLESRTFPREGGKTTRDRLETLMTLLSDGVDGFLADAATIYRRTAKLFYVVCRVARTLFAMGLCDCDSDDDKCGASRQTDEVEGTGMGDGELAEDAKDVSNEITSEEQLLGTRQRDEPASADSGMADGDPANDIEKDEVENGVEMEAAFDGETHGLKEQEQGDDGDESNNEDDQVSVDREFGDTGPHAEMVDQRLWNDDDDDHEECEGDTPLLGPRADGAGEKLDDEILAKDDDERSDAEGLHEAPSINEHTGQSAVEEDASQFAPEQSQKQEHAQNELGEGEAETPADVGEAADDVDTGGESGELPEDMDIDAGMEIDAGLEIDADEETNLNDEKGVDEDTGEPSTEGDVRLGRADEVGEVIDEAVSGGAVQGETALEETTSRADQQASMEAWGVGTVHGGDALESGDTDGDAGGHDNNAARGSDLGSGDGDVAFGRVDIADAYRAPNPHRDAGDALKHWHRRLDIADRNDGDASGPRQQDEDELDNGDNLDGSYEYAKRDERASAQALGGVGDDMTSQMFHKTNTERPDASHPKHDEHREFDPENEEMARRHKSQGNEELRESSRNRRRCDNRMNLRKERQLEPGDADKEPVTTAEAEPLLAEDAPSRPSAPYEAGGVVLNAVMPREHERDELTATEPCSTEASGEEASTAWRKHVDLAVPVTRRLCEVLRPVLAPTVASRLRGDYRTGKRLSMRRVVDYVASGYRRDKIWMRRTKPAKRAYQIVVAIDDSHSMHATGADASALTALAALSAALAQLEAGDLAVCAFGDETRFVHRFEDGPFAGAAATNAVARFRFDQHSTNAVALLRSVLNVLHDARKAVSVHAGTATCLQLALIVSDGHFDSGSRATLRRLQRDAVDDGVAVVAILLERPNCPLSEMKLITFNDGEVQATPYLDDYPFPCYVLLRDVAALPDTLALALKQWFEFHATQASR